MGPVTPRATELKGPRVRGARGEGARGRSGAEAASGAIVLKINPKPPTQLPLWREAGKRSKKTVGNLPAFP